MRGIFKAQSEIMATHRNGMFSPENAVKFAEDEFWSNNPELIKDNATHEDLVDKKCELLHARFHVGLGWNAYMVALAEYIIDDNGDIDITEIIEFAKWDVPNGCDDD